MCNMGTEDFSEFVNPKPLFSVTSGRLFNGLICERRKERKGLGN